MQVSEEIIYSMQVSEEIIYSMQVSKEIIYSMKVSEEIIYSMQVSEEIMYSSFFSSQNPARLVMVIKMTSYLDPNAQIHPKQIRNLIPQ